ncbi:hypothetical protein BKA81DRAFT_99929 [Phyllosticta paracitricarpa]
MRGLKVGWLGDEVQYSMDRRSQGLPSRAKSKEPNHGMIVREGKILLHLFSSPPHFEGDPHALVSATVGVGHSLDCFRHNSGWKTFSAQSAPGSQVPSRKTSNLRHVVRQSSKRKLYPVTAAADVDAVRLFAFLLGPLPPFFLLSIPNIPFNVHPHQPNPTFVQRADALSSPIHSLANWS